MPRMINLSRRRVKPMGCNLQNPKHSTPSRRSLPSGTNMKVFGAVLLISLCLSNYLVPVAQGFAIIEDSRSLDRQELMRKIQILGQLLQARQHSFRLPSEVLMSLENAPRSDEIRLVAGKRGPTSCINRCLTNGMSFVRCKSMCH